MVKKQRLSIFVVIFLLAFSLVSTYITPKASAASNFDSDISKFFKLQAFSKCLDEANFATILIKGESKTIFGFADGTSFNESSTGISVGYSVDAGNAQWICGEPSHANDWMKLIGYKDFTDFRDQNYKSKNDYQLELKGSKDDVIRSLKSKINQAMPSLSGAQKYLNYLRSFEKCASGPKNKNDINGTTIKVDNFVKKDGSVVKPAYFERTEADQISVGHGLGASDGRFACETIADRLNSLSDDYKKWADANKEEATALATTSSGGGANDDSCEAQTGVLAWLGCPLLSLIGGALNWIDAQINRLMIIDRPLYTNDNMYNAWAKFRNIGLTLLIVVMLIMVISTALDLGFLDAYTVKKAFPRMVASIIFITLSWWICVFMIDLFNTIGQGVLGLMTAPFGLQVSDPSLTSLFSVSAGGAAVQGAVIVVGAAALTLPGALGILLSWVGAAMLVLGISFLTLVARQMVIIVLVLFSPLAILSWIFPNNDKLWKFWWSTFTKLLIMYPLVMALIGAGRIFASVLAENTAGGAQGGLLNPLLKLTAYILPYAFIPFTFKAAGGVFGNLVGMANDRSKGAFDRLRKGRQKNYHRVGNDLTTKRSELTGGLQKLGSSNKGNAVTRAAFRGASRVTGAGNIEARMSAINAEQGKIINDQIATGRDDAIRGSTVALSALRDFDAAEKKGLARVNNGERQFKSLGGGWVNEAAVREGHARFKTQAQQQAALSYEMRKATTEEQIGGLVSRYSELGADYGMSDRQTAGMWIGAAFENQGQHLSLKHTSFDENGKPKLNTAGFASEAFEKKGTYALSQMSAYTIDQLTTAYDKARIDEAKAMAEGKISEADTHRQTQSQIQSIAETFMSRYGSSGAGQGGETPDGIPLTANNTPLGTPGAPGQQQQVYQTNTPGAASVAASVRNLAVHTGVYVPELPTPASESSGPGPFIPLQH